MKPLDCDTDIDGKSARGWICGVCGEVIPHDEVIKLPNGDIVHPECCDEIAALERHLSSLEFEVRYESDKQEMDAISKQIDAVRRKLKGEGK